MAAETGPHLDDSRVVGVFAYATAGKVLRFEDACVVADSEAAMRRYIAALAGDQDLRLQVTKLRFGQIRRGLESGAGYAFDRRSYARFFTLARRAGIDDLDGFPAGGGDEIEFMTVRFDQNRGTPGE